jgi:hypothetical protein
MVHYYIPATFHLYEFDDNRYSVVQGRMAQRWFSGFNGLIGEPPQNVTLAWSDGVNTVLVRTDEHGPWDREDARANAAHVALGGTALLPERGHVEPDETTAEINKIVAANDRWVSVTDVLDGAEDAQVLVWDTFALCYLQINENAVYIASTNLESHEFKIRKVRNWNSYDVDGSASFPLDALRDRS